ncbi:MAG: UvrD-helicase domain-containing protein [Sphaerochaetaceae bacterium]|nr:UvrD-helicase domain-containing protein [Sphaerochaetaceae bacterium]
MSEYTVPSRFTEEQKEAILINDSCVVSAGAGSGKTAVLSERFIRLVTEKRAHCNRILAITFTKKAAAEMKSRIYSLLLSHSLTEELPLFKEASISTVDSLLSEIARTGCVRFGISPAFAIADQDDFFKVEKDLARKVLENHKNSELTAKLLPVVSIDNLCSFFAKIASTTFSIAVPFEAQKQESALIEVYENSLDNLHDRLEDDIKYYISNLESDSKLTANVNMLSSYLTKRDRSKSHREKAGQLEQIVFDKKQGEKDNAPLAKELKTRIREAVKLLIPAEISAEEKAFIHAFYTAMEDYYNAVIEKKREMNTVSFSDVMQMALRILTDSRNIRDSYKERFKYIMVDEFQDNNDNYRQLIYLLSEKEGLFTQGIPAPEDLTEGKIFLVGDEKQSIYRFRGADVSVFKRMQEEIKKAGGKMIELETNFRTEPRLLQAFNTIFSRVMAPGDVSYDFEARFKHLKDRGNENVKPRLIIHTVEASEDEEPEYPLADAAASEAYNIAALIKNMAGNPQYSVCVKGVVRAPEYNDFAILYSSASSQSDYEKALRLSGIPYTVEESRSQTREALVNDFYSLLQLCIYINDSISFSAFINGPLSDGASASPDCLSEFDKKTIDTVKAILSEDGLAEAVSWIWNKAYRPFIISNPANQVYEEHYLWLYSLAVDFEKTGKGPSQFLSYLRPFIDDSEGSSSKGREVKVLRTEASGVSLMTVHKSKGLEFPIVILAGMDTTPRGPQSDLSFIYRNSNLLLPVVFGDNKLPKDPVSFLGLGTEKMEAEAELKRLFYVAATRAECHLVLSYTFKQDRGVCLKSLLNSTISDTDVQQELSDILEKVTTVQIEERQMYSYGRLDKQRIEKCRAWYENAEDINVDYSRREIAVTNLITRPEGLSKEPLKTLNSDSIIRKYSIQTDFGTLVHGIIESHIKKVEEPEFETENTEITESEIKTLKADARTLAYAFISSELYKKIKDSGMKIESEKAFMYYDSDRKETVEGVIDLLTYNDEKAVIYDFKTDSFKNPLEHKEQLGVYEKAVKSIWEEKLVSTEVLYLRELL